MSLTLSFLPFHDYVLKQILSAQAITHGNNVCPFQIPVLTDRL